MDQHRLSRLATLPVATNFVLIINVNGPINAFTVKWYKLTPGQFTASGGWLREDKCQHKKTAFGMEGPGFNSLSNFSVVIGDIISLRLTNCLMQTFESEK